MIADEIEVVIAADLVIGGGGGGGGALVSEPRFGSRFETLDHEGAPAPANPPPITLTSAITIAITSAITTSITSIKNRWD